MRNARFFNSAFRTPHSVFLLILLVALPLLAVTPSFWEIRTYDEFRRGKLANLSLTSDDQLILAPRYDVVFNTEQPLIWSTIADSKRNVYLGTGHDGKIYQVDPTGKGQLVADLIELDVLALAVDARDVLYAGTSPDGKVYKITPGAPPQVFFDPDVKYIWSLAFDRQGRLLVATGDQGVIYRVTADGKGEPFYDTDETHIISMAVDKDGNLIAGGDPKGYIYRISPEGKAFVLYDSGMREVHRLRSEPNGNHLCGGIERAGTVSVAPTPSTAERTSATGDGHGEHHSRSRPRHCGCQNPAVLDDSSMSSTGTSRPPVIRTERRIVSEHDSRDSSQTARSTRSGGHATRWCFRCFRAVTNCSFRRGPKDESIHSRHRDTTLLWNPPKNRPPVDGIR